MAYIASSFSEYEAESWLDLSLEAFKADVTSPTVPGRRPEGQSRSASQDATSCAKWLLRPGLNAAPGWRVE